MEPRKPLFKPAIKRDFKREVIYLFSPKEQVQDLVFLLLLAFVSVVSLGYLADSFIDYEIMKTLHALATCRLT